MTVESLTGGLFSSDPWGGSYGQFQLGISGVTGAFMGTDGGASSTTIAVTSEDVNAILAARGDTGVKKFTLGLGQVVLQ